LSELEFQPLEALDARRTVLIGWKLRVDVVWV
jgi:hypothetical protein